MTISFRIASKKEVKITCAFTSSDQKTSWTKKLTVVGNGYPSSSEAETLSKPACPIISVLPASFNFTSSSKTATFTISNSGGTKLTGITALLDGTTTYFTLSSKPSSDIEPGKSTTAVVTCSLTNWTMGPYTAYLKISHNDPTQTSPTNHKLTAGSGTYHPSTSDTETETETYTPTCFVADTWVLMGDRTARRISEIRELDTILTLSEAAHILGENLMLEEAQVLAVLHHRGSYELFSVNGIRTTPEHPWATLDQANAHFTPTSDLRAGHSVIRAYHNGDVLWVSQLKILRLAEQSPTVFNLTTTSRTYLVAAHQDGPWYLVHNTKPTSTL